MGWARKNVQGGCFLKDTTGSVAITGGIAIIVSPDSL